MNELKLLDAMQPKRMEVQEGRLNLQYVLQESKPKIAIPMQAITAVYQGLHYLFVTPRSEDIEGSNLVTVDVTKKPRRPFSSVYGGSKFPLIKWKDAYVVLGVGAEIVKISMFEDEMRKAAFRSRLNGPRLIRAMIELRATDGIIDDSRIYLRQFKAMEAANSLIRELGSEVGLRR